MMLAHKGYGGDDVRSSLLVNGLVIPPKANAHPESATQIREASKAGTEVKDMPKFII
jgi:hypothetical protein